MKKLTFFSVTLAFAFFASSSKANQSNCTNNAAGGFGHEDFEQEIALTPTVNAPTNAIGQTELEVECEDGINTTTLDVKVAGLDSGTYSVSVTDVTGTNAYDLGTLDVGSYFGNCGSVHGNGGGCGFGTNAPVVSTNVVNYGHGEFSLPSDLDPTNVAFLFIYDTNGVVDLTGDFTSLTNITALVYNKTVSVIPGTALQAQGQGTLTLAYKRGKTSSSFKLNASGLPGKQKLSLNANGATSCTTSTTTTGLLKVQALPHANLAGLQAVEAKDKNGKVVFSLKF